MTQYHDDERKEREKEKKFRNVFMPLSMEPDKKR
jgi:hypothetical protein